MKTLLERALVCNRPLIDLVDRIHFIFRWPEKCNTELRNSGEVFLTVTNYNVRNVSRFSTLFC